MNLDMLQSIIESAGPEDISEWIDEEEIAQMLEQQLEPHFKEIKREAQGKDAAKIQKEYREMPKEKREEAFTKTASDLIAVLRECREKPQVGFPKLKKKLRDPDVLEPLLLILQDEQNINPQYSEEKKHMASMTVRWAGASVFPEMYTQDEITELQRELDGQ